MMTALLVWTVLSPAALGYSWTILEGAGAAPKVSGHAASVDHNGRVLLFGGLTGSAGSPCTNALMAYDEKEADGSWQEVTASNEGPGVRMYAASATVGSDMYVIGGWDSGEPGSGGTFKDEVWRFSIDSSTWTQLAPLPCGPVSRHTACKLGDDTVIIQTFRGTLILDASTGTVREQPTSGTAPIGLSMCAAAPLGQASMLIFGGSSKTQQMTADVHVLDTATWTWRKLVAKAGKGGRLPTPRASSCAAPVDGSSCIIFGGAGLGGGGYDGGAGLVAFDETWRVRVDGDDAIWDVVAEAGANTPPPRVAASLSALPSGKLLLQGGWDPVSKATFDAPAVLTPRASVDE